MSKQSEPRDASVQAGHAEGAEGPGPERQPSEGSLVAIDMAIESALKEMGDGTGAGAPARAREDDAGPGGSEPVDLDFRDDAEPLVTDEEIEAAGPPPPLLFAEEKAQEEVPERLQGGGITYATIFKVGEGGMAEVYKARSVSARGVERIVAVKRVKPEYAHREDFRRMFLSEARLSLRLQHRNIASTFALHDDADGLMLVMDFIDGTDLKALIAMARKKGTALSPAFACYVAAELADALHYAHRLKDEDGRPLGLVHRDVSSANVKVSSSGDVKLLDFGIARADLEDRDKTAVGTMKGKLDYMSPEQAKGQPLDGRTDQWALGVLLAEMLTGTRVFRGPNERETWMRICRSTTEYVLGRLAGVPRQLQDIILRTLSDNPDARYATCGELAQVLRQYLAAVSQTSGIFFGADQAAAELEALEALPELDDATRASPGRAGPSASPLPYFREPSHSGTGSGPRTPTPGSGQHTPTPAPQHTPPPPVRESSGPASGPRSASGLREGSDRPFEGSLTAPSQVSVALDSQAGSLQESSEVTSKAPPASDAPLHARKPKAFGRPVLLAAAVLAVAVAGALALLTSRTGQPPTPTAQLVLPDEAPAGGGTAPPVAPAAQDEAAGAKAESPPAAPPSTGGPTSVPTDGRVNEPVAAAPAAKPPPEPTQGPAVVPAAGHASASEVASRRRQGTRRTGGAERGLANSPAAMDEPSPEMGSTPERAGDRDDGRVSPLGTAAADAKKALPQGLGVPVGTRIAACSTERADPAEPGPFAAVVSEDVVVDGEVRVPKRGELVCTTTGGAGNRVVGTCERLSFSGRTASFTGQLQGEDKRPGIRGPLETLTRLPKGTCFYVLVQSGF